MIFTDELDIAGLMTTVAFGEGFTEFEGIAGTVHVIVVFGLLLMPFKTMLGFLQLSILNGCIRSTLGAMVF